jgi:hypothetical protein
MAAVVALAGVRAETAPLRLVFVTGTVSRTGEAELDPFLILDAAGATVAPQKEGAYAFELLDRRGAVLERAELDLSFEQEVHGTDRREVRAIETTPFSLTLPLPETAVRARLVHHGATLAERSRSAHPPAIEITALEVALDRGVELRWSARDQDGDPLTHVVSYAADGRSFVTLAVDQTSPELRFDLDEVTAPATGAAVRVRASDGWNFAEAVRRLPPTR